MAMKVTAAALALVSVCAPVAAVAFDGHANVTNFWIGKGFSPAAAAGIADAVVGESSGDPLSVGDGGTSLGLYQHHAERMRRLVAAIENDQAFQELTKTDPIAAAHAGEIQAAPDREAARALFSRYFERPKGIRASLPVTGVRKTMPAQKETPVEHPKDQVGALFARLSAPSDVYNVTTARR